MRTFVERQPGRHIHRSRAARIFEELVMRSWWVVLIVIVCYATYEQAIKHADAEYTNLHQQLTALQREREQLLDMQSDLQWQVNSQSDPVWVELTLMKGLGLAPEGHTKVFFSKQAPQ